MEPTVVDGNGTETGHIIVTTIGGKNGQPKQVDCHATVPIAILMHHIKSTGINCFSDTFLLGLWHMITDY